MPWVDVHLLYQKHDPAKPSEIRQALDYAKRKAKARFYADENFPSAATEILRTRTDVLTAQEAGLRGQPDENQSAFALKEGRILVTCDRDYLNPKRFPMIHSPAIIVFDFGSGSTRDIRLAFRCLRNVLRVPQFYDKWAKFDASPDTWTESIRYLDGTTSRTRYRIHNRVLQEWVD